MAARFSGTPPMFAVGLISLGSRFVSPGLSDQVQRVVLTGRGKEVSLARQVSRFFRNFGIKLLSRYILIHFLFLFRNALHLWTGDPLLVWNTQYEHCREDIFIFPRKLQKNRKKVFANAIIALKLYEQRKLSVLSLKKCLPLLYMIRDVLS